MNTYRFLVVKNGYIVAAHGQAQFYTDRDRAERTCAILAMRGMKQA